MVCVFLGGGILWDGGFKWGVFENYINNDDIRPKKKLAQQMLQFTRTQINYEQYEYLSLLYGSPPHVQDFEKEHHLLLRHH